MKNHISLKTRLLKYLRNNYPKSFAKGELCDLARSETGMIGENVGRRLRELQNEGLITVEHRGAHLHDWYKAKPPKETVNYYVQGNIIATKKLYL
jgi:predicted transcriptional regulator